ncbi:MAG: hypothetical protein J7K89_03625 [Candidatus Cloacimonetes bacterium]|nr:hypothetical protein [Candidatus Cloacimonadota bacterium]
MKIKILLLLMLCMVSGSYGLVFRGMLASSLYYPSYPSIQYENPIWGVYGSAQLFRLYHFFGAGVSRQQSYASSQSRISRHTVTRMYLHHFHTLENRQGGFTAFGLLAGFKKTEIEYRHKKTDHLQSLNILRPLLGMHMSTKQFGSTLYWSQRENRHPQFEMEMKYRGKSGFTVVFGKSIKGVLVGMSADYYLFAGYEFSF